MSCTREIARSGSSVVWGARGASVTEIGHGRTTQTAKRCIRNRIEFKAYKALASN
jgi:hypothetical protein